MNGCKNVFEAILKYGHDEDFAPAESNEFSPTDAPAGSDEKIEILRTYRQRVSDLFVASAPGGITMDGGTDSSVMSEAHSGVNGATWAASSSNPSVHSSTYAAS